MAEKIKLVQGDTRPQLVLSLTDPTTGEPINITGATVRMRFRQIGSASVKEVLVGATLPGLVMPDGSVSLDAPYDQFGAGGRAAIDWTPTALDTAGEFEGEIEVTFADGTAQTVFDTLRFKVREEF